MKKSLLMLSLAAAAALAAPAANAALVQSFDFSGPITTGPVQASGVWYTDRYAPAGFSTSGGQLVQTISSNDSASQRPAAYSSSFYNTQGRKYDLDPGVTGVSVDLFVASSWATSGQRMAGLWGTAVDAANSLSSYPIIEFSAVGGAHFQGWDDVNGWVNYGISGTFAYDQMHTLAFVLDGSNWDYMLDGTMLGQVSALGSVAVGNVILQGYNNYNADVSQASYDIHWDNLVASNSVPEPASLALALPALIGVGLIRRRRNTAPLTFPA